MISTQTESPVTAASAAGFFARASEAARQASHALRAWLRGATGGQRYESYLRHASKCGHKPLSEAEFYLDDEERKYSRPNRCC
jgi:hypothetical protein